MAFKDNLRNSKHVIKGKFNNLTLLFKTQAELDNQLVDAAIFGRLEQARKLIAHGASPNAQGSLSLCVAVSSRNMPMLLTLLEAGQANGSDECALRVAVIEDRPVMAYKLMEHGASLDAAEKFIKEKGDSFDRIRIHRFREKYAGGIARVESRIARRSANKADTPKAS